MEENSRVFGGNHEVSGIQALEVTPLVTIFRCFFNSHLPASHFDISSSIFSEEYDKLGRELSWEPDVQDRISVLSAICCDFNQGVYFSGSYFLHLKYEEIKVSAFLLFFQL